MVSVVFLCNQTSADMLLLLQVDLRHVDEKEGTNVVERGVDLTEFYMSVEWDILEVPAVRLVYPQGPHRGGGGLAEVKKGNS